MHEHETDGRATCPFCAVPWSDAMLEAYAALSSDCSCCGGDAHNAVADDRPIPTEDLCCDSCSKPLFYAPKHVHS